MGFLETVDVSYGSKQVHVRQDGVRRRPNHRRRGQRWMGRRRVKRVTVAGETARWLSVVVQMGVGFPDEQLMVLSYPLARSFYSGCCGLFVPDDLTAFMTHHAVAPLAMPVVLVVRRAPAGGGCRP
ncbi:hypothetical protein BHM03_00001087 [Ensete ventricosum]|nr:hypothetical protein BHM03_00001087 [Ensete ventricosum]